jgi:hypothetical protein
MRWFIRALGVVLVGLTCLAAVAQSADPLYQTKTIVTGTDMRSRPEGFAACLRDVLVKVSGNPKFATDPRVQAKRVDALVADFSYRDRYGSVPRHDEQGTRDRPYDLTVQFDPAKIDRLLADLGDGPWTSGRPELLARVTVITRSRQRFAVTADGDTAKDHREALAAAAGKYGMRVALPATASPAFPDAPAGSARLRGSLTWDEPAGGWAASWQLRWKGRRYEWGVKGVSFDEAYRNMVLGGLQVLSGHGNP